MLVRSLASWHLSPKPDDPSKERPLSNVLKYRINCLMCRTFVNNVKKELEAMELIMSGKASNFSI